MNTKDKLIAKLKEYINYLIIYHHGSLKATYLIRLLNRRMNKFESEIAALEAEMEKEEQD